MTHLIQKPSVSLDRYIALGMALESRLIACPAVSMVLFASYWIEGLSGKYSKHEDMLKMRLEQFEDKFESTGVPWSLQRLAVAVKTASTKIGEYVDGETDFIEGKDATKEFADMRSYRREVSEPAGVRTNPVDLNASGRQERKCTNPHCEYQLGHGTDFCVSYGGKMEGQYKDSWSKQMVDRYKNLLEKKKAQHGPSKSLETHSSQPIAAPADEQQIQEIYKKRGVYYVVAQLKAVHSKSTESQ